MKRFFVFVLAILSISTVGYSQLSIANLDMSKIPQRKIRAYLNMQSEHDIYLLSDFKASSYPGIHLPDYISMENTYLVKEDPDSLWHLYMNTSVSKSWSGKRFSFGLLYSKWSDKVRYNDEYFSSLVDTGQVFFVNLRLLGGTVNFALGLEVVDIDIINKAITFNYLESGKSQGQQIIQFFGTPEGYTKIVHFSNFKSDNPFRDKYLYPYFHTRVINEFHRNMSRRISNEKGYFKIMR